MKVKVAFFLFLPNRYDDYDYGEINQLLDRSFKVYIKTVVCTPEKTTKRMYDSFWRQFEHSEKVQSAWERDGTRAIPLFAVLTATAPASASAGVTGVPVTSAPSLGGGGVFPRLK